MSHRSLEVCCVRISGQFVSIIYGLCNTADRFEHMFRLWKAVTRILFFTYICSIWEKNGSFHAELYALICLCQFAFFLFNYWLTKEKKGLLLCLFASRAQSMHSFTEFGHKNEYLFTHLIFINKTMRLFFFLLFSVLEHNFTGSEKVFMKCALIWRRILFL